MGKVIHFPFVQGPEKFGPERVTKTTKPKLGKNGQLNLFAGGKVVRMHQLTTFEEALMVDDQGDRESARSLYRKAIAEGAALSDAYCNLGIMEFQDGNFSKAIDYFTLSLKHDPRHFEAHYNLANLYGEAGNFPLAKIHYQISQEIEPSFPNSYFNLGLTLAMNNEFSEAVRVLNLYLQLTPESEHRQANDLIAKLSQSL